jgi:CBS domain containing-hemolysin-like protein
MQEKQVSRILVVDSSQKPIGMISLQDLSGNISQSESANTLHEIKH